MEINNKYADDNISKNVNFYQREANRMILDIYNNAYKSKIYENIKLFIEELTHKDIDYQSWKTYYKKFRKYIATKVLDINVARNFALALNLANVNCNGDDKLELLQLRDYLTTFINLLDGLIKSNNPKTAKII